LCLDYNVRTYNAARFLAESFGPWPSAAHLASKSCVPLKPLWVGFTALHNCAESKVVFNVSLFAVMQPLLHQSMFE